MDFRHIFSSKQVIPWTADLEYWVSGRELEHNADPDWRTIPGYLKLCDSLGVFPYYRYEEFWCGMPEYDETVNVQIITTPEKVETIYNTPIGSLHKIEILLKESASWACSKFPVSTSEELSIFEYIIEHRTMRSSYLDSYQERLQLFQAYHGVPAIGMPRSPLSAFFYEWAGIQNGVYLLLDEGEQVDRIFSMMALQEQPLLDALCALRPPIVHFADNMSSDNMTGYFNHYFGDIYEHRISTLHSANIACVVHLDGVVKPIIKNLAATGLDGIEAITPAPGGDQDIEDIRSLAENDHIVLWGGVPGVMFSDPYTWDDLKTHVRRVIDCWKGTPFILGVADQVPADGKIELVKSISDFLLEEYS